MKKMLLEKIPSIEFYGLGQLDTEHESVRSLSSRCHWVRFEVHGSEQVRAILVNADEDLDPGISLELANTLASRVAGQLSNHEEWRVMISPPKYSAGLAPNHLVSLSKAIEDGKAELHSFRFLMKEHIYPVQLIFVTEEENHAEAHRSVH